MSRRDWFRLRKPQAKTQPQLGEQPAALTPSEEPVNHGGVDLSSLPPMHEATLDDAEVAALFADLEQHASEVRLMVRAATDQSAQLGAAQEQLLSGKVKKLQVRYQWQHAQWIDTLERTPKGFRLVRIQHTAVPR